MKVFKPKNESDRRCRRKYTNKRHKAMLLGIAFKLTYENYKQKLDDANITYTQIGEYHLARLEDMGGYTVENCRFITAEDNRLEAVYYSIRDDKNRGGGLRMETDGRINHRWKGFVKTPFGVYESFKKIPQDKMKFSRSYTAKLVKNQDKGYSLIDKNDVILLTVDF